MKKIYLILFFYISVSAYAQTDKQIRLVLVRHAEKSIVDPADKDPELTTNGALRALALKDSLQDLKFDYVYSTDYKRTIATALPTANANNLKIELYDASHLNTFVETIKAHGSNKTILIVGHSNTILETIEAFGAERPIGTIGDQDYDNLFLVLLQTGNKAITSVEKFGPVAHDQNTEVQRQSK